MSKSSPFSLGNTWAPLALSILATFAFPLACVTAVRLAHTPQQQYADDASHFNDSPREKLAKAMLAAGKAHDDLEKVHPLAHLSDAEIVRAAYGSDEQADLAMDYLMHAELDDPTREAFLDRLVEIGRYERIELDAKLWERVKQLAKSPEDIQMVSLMRPSDEVTPEWLAWLKEQNLQPGEAWWNRAWSSQPEQLLSSDTIQLQEHLPQIAGKFRQLNASAIAAIRKRLSEEDWIGLQLLSQLPSQNLNPALIRKLIEKPPSKSVLDALRAKMAGKTLSQTDTWVLMLVLLDDEALWNYLGERLERLGSGARLEEAATLLYYMDQYNAAACKRLLQTLPMSNEALPLIRAQLATPQDRRQRIDALFDQIERRPQNVHLIVGECETLADSDPLRTLCAIRLGEQWSPAIDSSPIPKAVAKIARQPDPKVVAILRAHVIADERLRDFDSLLRLVKMGEDVTDLLSAKHFYQTPFWEQAGDAGQKLLMHQLLSGDAASLPGALAMASNVGGPEVYETFKLVGERLETTADRSLKSRYESAANKFRKRMGEVE